jgi:hypothetical protein
MRRATEREIAFEKHLGRAEHRVFSLCYMCMSSIKLETDVQANTHTQTRNARTCAIAHTNLVYKMKQEKELAFNLFLFKTPRHLFRVALMLLIRRTILWKIFTCYTGISVYLQTRVCSFGKGKKRAGARQWIRQCAAAECRQTSVVRKNPK